LRKGKGRAVQQVQEDSGVKDSTRAAVDAVGANLFFDVFRKPMESHLGNLRVDSEREARAVCFDGSRTS
jgi:hypothetical protein